MQAPSFPPNEAQRIASLHATRLLDTEPEEMFDRVTRLAARLFNMPTALVTLVDKDRQWFKSRHGLEAPELPRSSSFCGHAVLSEEPLLVPDALHDARFADNPLVTGAPFIRFYAGVPIHSIERMKIGTLCLIDYQPRNFSGDDMRSLQDLARSVEDLIQHRQLAMTSVQLVQLINGQDSADQTRARRLQELEHLVTHDTLTGLPNRAMLLDAMRASVTRWQGATGCGVVAFIDIDHFKTLNDSLGYHAGDQVLVAVAEKLNGLLGAGDIVARAGADEFVVLFNNLEHGQSAHFILQQMKQHISCPIRVGSQEITLSCSIGMARYPEDGLDADILINSANTALQHAKKVGGARIETYTVDLSRQTQTRFALENQLRYAVQRGELVLHYQPKVNLQSGCVVGVEALVRWHHSELGLIAPTDFIPLAEESGLIVPIGEWVLQTACLQMQAWRQQGFAMIPVAVNVSSRQFLQNDIVATVAGALQAAGLGHGSLELELTESVSMGNPEKSAGLMRKLKDLGVSLSIDDFGTGYSSLSYLKRLPIDKIKIDRSFVHDITRDEEALAIVQAIIAMAHRLNLNVVAEGVETEQQLAFLRANLCDEMQGYYFSKPLTVDDCTALFASGRCLQPN